MANFNTHITVANITTAVAASAIYSVDLISLQEMMLLWLVGTLGGILPDIDSDHSTAIQIISYIVMGALSIFVILLFAGHLSLVELWLLVLSVILSMRWIIRPIFTSYTRHRGIFHSLLAGLFFWFSITALASLHYESIFAWTLGFFCFFGYVVHLSLDELYSVDLLNTTIKRSFGTALKPFSMKYKKESLIMAMLTLWLWYLTPPAAPFLSQYSSGEFVVKVFNELLPSETLFGVTIDPKAVDGA